MNILKRIRNAKEKNLNTLYLSNNQLSSLPPELFQLKSLKELYLNNNQLKILPPQIGQLENLYILDLRNNQLKTLPPELWQLKNLVALDLGNNQLKYNFYIGKHGVLLLSEKKVSIGCSVFEIEDLLFQPVTELLEFCDEEKILATEESIVKWTKQLKKALTNYGI